MTSTRCETCPEHARIEAQHEFYREVVTRLEAELVRLRRTLWALAVVMAGTQGPAIIKMISGAAP